MIQSIEWQNPQTWKPIFANLVGRLSKTSTYQFEMPLDAEEERDFDGDVTCDGTSLANDYYGWKRLQLWLKGCGDVLSDSQYHKSIKYYTTTFRDINNYLTGTSVALITKEAELAMESLQQAILHIPPLTHDLFVFRGLCVFPHVRPFNDQEESWLLGGFTSCSVDSTVALCTFICDKMMANNLERSMSSALFKKYGDFQETFKTKHPEYNEFMDDSDLETQYPEMSAFKKQFRQEFMQSQQKQSYVFRIFLPRGSRCLYVDTHKLTSVPNQREIILFPGTRFVNLGVQNSGAKYMHTSYKIIDTVAVTEGVVGFHMAESVENKFKSRFTDLSSKFTKFWKVENKTTIHIVQSPITNWWYEITDTEFVRVVSGSFTKLEYSLGRPFSFECDALATAIGNSDVSNFEIGDEVVVDGFVAEVVNVDKDEMDVTLLPQTIKVNVKKTPIVNTRQRRSKHKRTK
jgi:hypothetical protein